MSNINRVNELYLKSIASTFARLEYNGDYKPYMVRGARDLSEFPQVVAKMQELGIRVPHKGELCPYKSVRKVQTYPIHLGGSLEYVKMQERKLERNDFGGATYEPKFRKPHKFSLYRELIYLGLDLQTIYFTAYPVADGKEKPKAHWFVDGIEVSKYVILPWCKSDDFKMWVEGIKTVSVFKDENGNNLTDKNGEEITLREFIEVKLENCRILVNGEDIREKMFEKVSYYSDADLIAMRDAYISQCKREFEEKHNAWKMQNG